MSPGYEDDWHRAMRSGAFERAWRISDRILARRLARAEPQHSLPRHLQGIWNGQPLAGAHVLVRCYHGLGDTVQYIRFAGRLRALAREVTVWAQPPLAPLLATAAGVDRVLPLHDGIPELAYDVDIESMELAHALRITAADLPGPVPYLRRPSLVPGPRPDRTRLTAGLVWSGGDWNPRRSMRFEDLRPLLAVPGVDFVSLQCGPARGQCRGAGVADAACDDIAVFAARLCRLDLLITVDTFAAHLGGALAVPVWLMLPGACDWRWMERAETSVWYPTMRLFRQRRPGDWTGVVRDIARELATSGARARKKRRNKAVNVTFAR
jgi:hypothetical protein